jgi:ATP-dependent Lhr-like helicase
MAPVLERFGYMSKGHHGSLAQAEREAAEHAVKTERRIVLFSTSTLEIGIDIGDIDLVVLNGPAPDMPAFLQRIGRGNRRTSKTRVMLCHKDPGEALIQAAMLDGARCGFLGPAEIGPCYAVARQQLASFIFQSARLERRESIVVELLESHLPPTDTRQLIDHLVSISDLQRGPSGISLGEDWLDATERGEIHCNIEGQPGYTVSDQSTGDQIAVNIRYSGGQRMNIAGNKLHVTSVVDRDIEVRRTSVLGGEAAKWSYARSSFVRGASQPQAVRRYLKFAESQWPMLLTDQGTFVFHFGGARRKACLELLATRAGVEKELDFGDFYIRLPGRQPSKPSWLIDVGTATLEVLLPQHLEKLEKALARPKANKKLPIELRIVEVREWLNVPSQLAAIQNSEWVRVDDIEIQHVLEDLTNH